MKNKGKILAIDYGDNNVGLASCDEDRQMIFVKGCIKDFKSLDNLFEEIKKICEEDGIHDLVFGIPHGNEGQETTQTERLRMFGKRLSHFLGDQYRVILKDESYSSFEAQNAMREMNDPDVKKKYSEHEMAAKVILERHLKKTY